MLCLKQNSLKNILAALILVVVLVPVIITIYGTQTEDDGKYFNETIYSTNIRTHKIFYRKDWKGVPPRKQLSLRQAEFVVISHSNTHTCNDSETCMRNMRIIQKRHLSFGYLDIGYNFLIGSDANIYVGRGWDTVSILGNLSIGIQVIGNFAFDSFNSNMAEAIEVVIEEGLRLNKITENYKLIGENQTSLYKYLSPGLNIYKEIKMWPHFYSKIVFGTNFQTN